MGKREDRNGRKEGVREEGEKKPNEREGGKRKAERGRREDNYVGALYVCQTILPYCTPNT